MEDMSDGGWMAPPSWIEVLGLGRRRPACPHFSFFRYPPFFKTRCFNFFIISFFFDMKLCFFSLLSNTKKSDLLFPFFFTLNFNGFCKWNPFCDETASTKMTLAFNLLPILLFIGIVAGLKPKIRSSEVARFLETVPKQPPRYPPPREDEEEDVEGEDDDDDVDGEDADSLVLDRYQTARTKRAFGKNEYLLPENFRSLRRKDIPVTYRLHDDLLRYYR